MPLIPDAMARVLVLVCSYNEGANLPHLFSQIQTAAPGVDMLLIDDGSNDDTYAWLANHHSDFPMLRVINRGRKLGLGTAIRDGLHTAVAENYDYCVNLDADLSHDPSVLPDFIAAMSNSDLRQPIDLVIGSRYVDGGGLENCSWKRIYVSKSVNFLARLIIGWHVRDCSSAYRCYRVASLANRIDLGKLENASYGFLEEILWYLWRGGSRIHEIPIIYSERERGISKISLNEAWQTFTTLLRLNRFKRSPSHS